MMCGLIRERANAGARTVRAERVCMLRVCALSNEQGNYMYKHKAYTA